MTVKGTDRKSWVRFVLWAALYVAWIAWHGNWWWLFGLPVIFEFCVSRRLKAWIDRMSAKSHAAKVISGWLDAIIFAVVVVTFINIFFFQAFKIPSSSMESSLLTGDYLFVSKTAYGPKLPQTPLSMPFVHNTMPFSGKESYSTALQFKYRRIKGFGHVKRDDYVVFSFPHGDTVLSKAPAEDYYTHVRLTSRDYAIKTYGPIRVRPVDKKDHYVKRCVAVAGDTLRVIDGQVYVNGQAQESWPGIQNTYKVVTDGSPVNPVLLRDMGFNLGEIWYSQTLPGYPALPLTDERKEKFQALANVVSIEQNVDIYPPDYPDSEEMLFPFVATGWTRDNYGPLWIPAKGESVVLTADNLPLYRRIIEVYEGNRFEELGEGRYAINGEETDRYTFQMDYYFMMGDNRHNSLDSRYWGFVPEDHIVGKPRVIWMSTDANQKFPRNIRWQRLLKFL
ncbi:MAG: signal peptidase I [Bacteroidales bacterium]|nr:signal peptidase I [Bacteroidales bacterium]